MDLPGVPAGTQGKIKVINGFQWRRHWVFFENGVDVGQLDGDDLVRREHWDDLLAERASEAEVKAVSAEATATPDGDGDTPEATADGEASDSADLRSLIPAHLLERSREARDRLRG